MVAVAAFEGQTQAPIVRIAPGSQGVSIWSERLFADASSAQLRELLSRIFAVDEVASVEINRATAVGQIRYGTSGDPSSIWRKLSQAITGANDLSAEGRGTLSLQSLYLDGPFSVPITITRIGTALSSWQIRFLNQRRIRLTHPILRRRPDIAYRLEEALTRLLGVRRCRTSTVSGSLSVYFDSARISPDQLIRQVERMWPVILVGVDGPPSSKRLLAATGLFGLSATGQFFVPAVRPFALVGVALYGFPNVVAALRQLSRGEVGLPAMYSFGLALMLLSGMPFNSTLFAILMQSWPRLAHGTFSRSQRRLFSTFRQRSAWARLRLADQSDIQIDVADLRNGDVIVVYAGDVVPIDGTIVGGLAAIDEEQVTGVSGAVDKVAGDEVHATSFVRNGQVLIRADKVEAPAIAQEIAALLPHQRVDDLPSSYEAERVANRNAKPALGLALASVFVRRLVRPAQAIIRPDYITAHRLGAQLAILNDLGKALYQGIVFRHPSALDRLAATDIYVIDEAEALSRRRIEISTVFDVSGVTSSDVVRYAAAAFPPLQNERVQALRDWCENTGVIVPSILHRRRVAGAVLFEDDHGHKLEIFSAALHPNDDWPANLQAAIGTSEHASDFDIAAWPREHLLRPLIVRRDGRVIGAIAFGRVGPLEASAAIERLRVINRRARFVHISSKSQYHAEGVARDLGVETAIGGLDPMGKAKIVREFGPRTMWVGDGSTGSALPVVAAASVSVSLSGYSNIAGDQADILFLQPSLQNLLPLRRLANAHRSHLDADYRAVNALNLVGAAGGIFANFGGLQAGIISNAGTAYVYLRHRNRLRHLVSNLDAHQALLTTDGRETEGQHAARIVVKKSDTEPYVETPMRTTPDLLTNQTQGV